MALLTNRAHVLNTPPAATGFSPSADPSRSRCRSDVTIDSAHPAVTEQAVDEPVCPVPLPGEPASQFPFGRDYGGADRRGDQVGQGSARIGAAGGRDGVGLVPADQLAGVLVPFTGGDLQR